MLKTTLKWTGRGAVIGCAGYSMFLMALASVHTFNTLGIFPPDLLQSLYIGGVLGFFYGLYKAGIRLHIP